MTRSQAFLRTYSAPDLGKWTGRRERSITDAYWHQVVDKINLGDLKLDWSVYNSDSTVIIGYKCDEGVKRNQGRVGAADGPDAIRNMLGSLPNHYHSILDAGDIACIDENMEQAQVSLAESVVILLEQELFPIILGGGHDVAYGQYSGIRAYLDKTQPNASIGIINLDAHFDLRSNEQGNNSGTPFYQIAGDCQKSGHDFHYLCLGIQPASNTSQLFETADSLGVEYIVASNFNMHNEEEVYSTLKSFVDKVDYIYLTIDLDGFSSAYAPGVSAPSPLGFSPDIAFKCVEYIALSGKLISADLAEMSPEYDIDNHTARLASRLIHTLATQKK